MIGRLGNQLSIEQVLTDPALGNTVPQGVRMKILIVEDDPAIVRQLTALLNDEGYETECAISRSDARALIRSRDYQLALLDISLPDGDGFQVYRDLKDRSIPAIFLTASEDENTTVRALELGAEDYVSKPFRVRELISRIRKAVRRSVGAAVHQIGVLSIDLEKGIVRKHGAEITLSALEYRILTTFVSNRGILLTRGQLLEEIWDVGGDFVNDNTLTVYIKRLREKLEDDPQSPQIIRTVRGIGYRMD